MKLLLKIGVIAFVSYVIGYFLTVSMNPEVLFWAQAIEKRDEDLEKIRTDFPDSPAIIFTGGSSCAFSVDPESIRKITGLPSVNLGLPVACGHEYIFHQALRRCRPGDILILALEPDLLCFPNKGHTPSRLGYGLDAKTSNPVSAVFTSSGGSLHGTSGWLSTFRPGSRYFMALCGRTFSGKGYRYKPEDLRNLGRTETPIKLKAYNPSGKKSATSLSAEGRDFLRKAAALASAKNVRIAYSMPWRLTQATAVTHNRSANQRILDEICSIMPVLNDPALGVSIDSSIYSDSEWHLDLKGSELRSLAIANGINSWLE